MNIKDFEFCSYLLELDYLSLLTNGSIFFIELFSTNYPYIYFNGKKYEYIPT